MKINVRLEYVHPWPNHIGLFVARKMGWYEQHGWDVPIISDGTDRGNPADLLAAGEYDVASVRLGELAEHRHSDTPLLGVATFNQTQLSGIYSVKSSGITKFRDLENKTVAIPPVPRLTQMVKEAMAADGGDFEKINAIYPDDWEPDIRAVEKGVFDAVFNVLGWEPFQGITPPQDVVFLDFDHLGVALHHSYFLCFREETCRENPQLVRDFLTETVRGYEYARENPAEAIKLCSSVMLNMQPEVLRSSLDYMIPSMFDSQGRWGRIDLDLVRSYTQWMVAGGFTSASVADAEQSVTNDFLPN